MFKSITSFLPPFRFPPLKVLMFFVLIFHFAALISSSLFKVLLLDYKEAMMINKYQRWI